MYGTSYLGDVNIPSPTVNLAPKPLPTSVTNYKVPITDAGTGKKWWEVVTDFIGKAADAYKKVEPAVSDIQKQIKALKDSQLKPYIPGAQDQPLPNAAQPMSMGTKIAIGVAATAVVGGITYAAVQSSKKGSKK